MVTETQDELDRQIKELEREKREEELRQLKANARVRWVTPTALAALLPVIAGFGLWLLNEVKQYNAGYRALLEKDQLEQQKESLQKQKDGLNLEIGTLLQLKEHYAAQAKQLRSEVETKQEIMDKTYLRAVFFSFESTYALGHVEAMGPGPDRETLEMIGEDVMKLPKESGDRIREVLDRYALMGDMIKASQEAMNSFRKAVDLIPASDWARRLQPRPSGSDIPGRSLMVSDSAEGTRYYDVTEGRFLTKEEAQEAKN